MRTFLGGVVLACMLVLPLAARAATADFPKESPAFTVDVPAGYTANYSQLPDRTSMSVDDADGAGYFSVETIAEGVDVSDADGAKSQLVAMIKADLERQHFVDVSATEPANATVAGQPAFTTKVTAKYHDRPYAKDFTIFSLDGSKWFLAYVSGDGTKVLQTVKGK